MKRNSQECFYTLANKWKNIFLEWIPWSWKTYALNKWREDNPDKTIVTVAYTWVAAINCWWATIHSTFWLFWNEYRFINKQFIDWQSVDVLIIDEISMVSCDLFDYIDRVLRKSRKSILPFWWLQVICVWDLNQIPPIFNLKKDEERKRYEELKWNVFFNNSEAYKNWRFEKVFLTKNNRSDNIHYNNLLTRIRDWDLSAIEEFNKWDNEDYIHLMAYNTEVDYYNNKLLNKLPWKVKTFKAEISWVFNTSFTITPEILDLKVWARIMVTVNCQWLINWDLWTVLKITKDWILIYSDRLKENKLITIQDINNCIFDDKWKKKIIWTFKQYPLRLAYWITLNKSQWLTLENYVFNYHPSINISSVYVALSRWTDFNSVLINYD